MATRIILLRESTCGDVENILSEPATVLQDFQINLSGHGRKWKCRSIGSKSLLLILIWAFIIRCSLGFILHKMEHFHSGKEEDRGAASLWTVRGETLLGIATLSISCPIASLLAEVVISRYKLVSYSLKAMWSLAIVGSVISVCEGSLPVEKSTLYTIQVFTLVIPQYVLLGGFLASAVKLGIDQINGGSNSNISSFLQWLGWAYFSAVAIPDATGPILYTCTALKASEVSMFLSLLSVLLLSVGLILDFCFHHKLVKEPVIANPVSLIFKVLKYAAKHKYPVQRSAFTYCENEQPTRLDYGKSKYGGPFTTEQVEDVKTFWRILLVVSAISIMLTPQMLVLQSALVTEESETHCIQAASHSIIEPYSAILYFVPLYELLVYPFLRDRGPSILQSAGIGTAAVIFLALYGSLAETVQYFTNDTYRCMFAQKDPGENNIVNFAVGIPFNFILGFTVIVFNKASIEFICAQAPYNMSGLLMGLFFTLQTLFITFGNVLYKEGIDKFDELDTSTCGIWFYLITLVLSVVSSALLGLAIRWYKARERDEITRSQDLVEEVYHKYIPGSR